jgi:hypothetical protein
MASLTVRGYSNMEGGQNKGLAPEARGRVVRVKKKVLFEVPMPTPKRDYSPVRSPHRDKKGVRLQKKSLLAARRTKKAAAEPALQSSPPPKPTANLRPKPKVNPLRKPKTSTVAKHKDVALSKPKKANKGSSSTQREIRALIDKVTIAFEQGSTEDPPTPPSSVAARRDNAHAAKQVVGDILRHTDGLGDATLGPTGSDFVLRKSVSEWPPAKIKPCKLTPASEAGPRPPALSESGEFDLKANEIAVNRDEEELQRRAEALQKDMDALHERKVRLELAKLEQELRKEAKIALKRTGAETQLRIDEKVTQVRESCMSQLDKLRKIEFELSNKITEMTRMKQGVEQKKADLQSTCERMETELVDARRQTIHDERLRLGRAIADRLKSAAKKEGFELELDPAEL